MWAPHFLCLPVLPTLVGGSCHLAGVTLSALPTGSAAQERAASKSARIHYCGCGGSQQDCATLFPGDQKQAIVSLQCGEISGSLNQFLNLLAKLIRRVPETIREKHRRERAPQNFSYFGEHIQRRGVYFASFHTTNIFLSLADGL